MNNTKNNSWFNIFRKLKFPRRKYKDRLFQRVFRDKKDLLDLYNAINNTNYSNPDDLEITTLEDVIFMSMKNDKSFVISSTMNLYEHQSTVNPNMPIRGLLYFAQLYDEYIKLHDLNIYGKKLVKLPTPQYIVFYNGADDMPDDTTLYLSNAFELAPDSADLKPALECTARVLNVNFGHNKELMDKCIRLYHYSIFIAKVNEYIEQGLPIIHAIDHAIDYALKNDILVDILTVNRSEVNKMLLTEFDEKKFAKTIRSEGREEGISIGREEGISIGREEGISIGREEGISIGREKGQDNVFAIMDAISAGNDTVEKLVALGYDPDVSQKLLSKLSMLK